MAKVMVKVSAALRPWARALLWLGKRSPYALGLLVWPIGFDRFVALVTRYGVRTSTSDG